jgi:predicted nucleic acid-binding protein
MKKILLDTNVVLAIALNREPFVASASLLFDKIDEKNIQAFISASTITDIFYIISKSKGKLVARNFIEQIIEILDVIAIDKEVVKKAVLSDILGFEDAVQIKAVEINNLDLIITRNKIDFVKSNIPVFTPAESLEKLN